MEPLLKIEGLSKRYPGFCLDGVSFSLAPGRIMGLIGKNGAGKSTTLKAMLNMVSPQSGRVTMVRPGLLPARRSLQAARGRRLWRD